MKTKLTPAQFALLQERQCTCIDTYKPFIALRDKQLVNAGEAPYDRANWAITEQGEQVLAELNT